ncbi:MAG: class I SAM-dependent methyltransferase [Gemmataceae bacterium]|nr:class I SAM-dependent methyltransferase [Gemmataceae bacterium]MCI0742939.1 class I SAM-dependent methyltransferase [Gemmataceae bacterium]
MLVIPESEIRRHGPGRALAVCWRQWRAERRLTRRGVRFRDTDADAVAAAYAAMSEREFDAINGRQDWANWRTIPRALSGHVPDRPLRVLDLGCGAGSSTQVLAFYCPSGSHVTGYEIAEPLLAFARRRDYRHRDGNHARVDFVCQGITETFLQANGQPVPDGSVDLVNASGVVGHHLTPATFPGLRAELVRLLGPDGVALLDIGPTLRGEALRPLMTEAGFHYLGHHKSWFGDPTGEMAFSRINAQS